MMIFIDIKCIKIALLLCFVDGVVSYPKLDVYNGDSVSSKEMPNSVKKHVNLPNLGDGQLNVKQTNDHKHQHEGDTEVRSSETNEDVEGSLKSNNNINKQQVRTEPENKNQSTDGTVIENLKMKYRDGKKQTKYLHNLTNDTNTKAKQNKTINRTNDNDTNDLLLPEKPGVNTGKVVMSGKNNNVPKYTTNRTKNSIIDLTGDINIKDDDSIEGTINLPDEYNSKPDTGFDEGQDNNADGVTGNVNIDDDGNIDGTVNVPDDSDNGKPGAGNGNQSQGDNADDVTGEINIDDNGNVDGTVNVPDEIDVGKPGIGNGNQGQGDNADDVTGEINIDDDGNIDGTVNVPDDGDNGKPDAEDGNTDQGNNADDVTGHINIDDDGNVDGTVNVPDDMDDGKTKAGNGNKDQDYDTDGITGDINIDDDGNVEGTVNVPDDIPGAWNGNKDQSDDTDVITGNINIDDDGNVEGTVNVPDDIPGAGSGNKDKGDDTDDITGDLNIDDDGNVEGTVNVPDDIEDGKPGTGNGNKDQGDETTNNDKKSDCWMDLKTKPYLDALDAIDAKYSIARSQYHDKIGPEFNKNMMQVLLSTQGKAPRAIHQAQGNHNIIPAGLNLGGFGMMRLAGSMLFFHRLKLRNSTVFRVDFLEANPMHMTLVARLSLNDLHLQGAYERATTEGGKSVLYFLPTYGELDVLMRSVNYKMEGRLRMLNNRLLIEVINSDIITRDILLSYANSTATATNTAFESIEDFVGRIKCDLDIWLKDYFNDYLMYFGIIGGGKNSDIQLYEKEKTIKANEYADHAIKGIKKHLRKLKAANVMLPSFTLLSVLNHRIELKNGILRGLDSIYRRSVAMIKKDNSIRTLDMMIGFSNLKVEYKYEATLIAGTPPLSGLLMLTSDELSARLEISQVQDSKVLDMNVDSILQLKSESLTVEGPANRLIADFKFLLENAIIAIMTNVMKHNVKMLKTLTRCEPDLWGEVSDISQYFNETDNTKPNNADNTGAAANYEIKEKWDRLRFLEERQNRETSPK